MNWHTITFLGDSAITVPGACILALWLAVNRLWRPMLAWLIAFGGAMLIVVISKLLFMGWDIRPPLLNFTGFSGHTASSCALYLSVALLLTRRSTPAWRTTILAITALLVTAVGLSRLMIKVHSESEVLLGLLVGASAAWTFGLSLREPAPALRHFLLPFALAAGLLMTGFDKPAPTQSFLQELAKNLSGRTEVYVRHDPL
ncbi:phosphatase PAP2 family protein [Herbaspirillum huttiense F1]|uniref:phosphatase PAP2 family protein n=1 Tax=Herbaspirillum TaxID=963 RepID=UPI0010647F55|nr:MULTISPECIES: phosphatase PAP2 family protein [Herbaspirillum]MBP1312902.1 membrane-associated phospholipid phosphatase [Herbaspirillum sp. 1130]MDT0355617.1 phosphatase PAP2 family protein [Herbaspirillum huttiense F1]